MRDVLGLDTSSNTIALKAKDSGSTQRRNSMEKVRDLCAFW